MKQTKNKNVILLLKKYYYFATSSLIRMLYEHFTNASLATLYLLQNSVRIKAKKRQQNSKCTHLLSITFIKYALVNWHPLRAVRLSMQLRIDPITINVTCSLTHWIAFLDYKLKWHSETENLCGKYVNIVKCHSLLFVIYSLLHWIQS